MKKMFKVLICIVLCATMLFSLNACGHKHIWTTATCTEPSVCEKCGEVNQPATGHNFAVLTTVEEATCVSDGLLTKKCDCGATESEVIKASSEKHDFTWTVVTEATCTVDGVQKKSCAYCDETETKAIKASGHDFSEWKTTKEATCTQTGTSARTCNNCQKKESETIPKLGHNFDEGYCTRCNKGIVTITFPQSPVSIKENQQNSSYFRVTVGKVTAFSWEYQYESGDEVVVKIYWSGEKTYSSGSCKLRYTIYDSEGYGIKSGTSASPSVAVGEKFKGDSITVYGLKKGESYTFVVQ